MTWTSETLQSAEKVLDQLHVPARVASFGEAKFEEFSRTLASLPKFAKVDIVESLETGAQTMRNVEVQFTGKNNLLCSLELEMDIVSPAEAAARQ